MVGALSLRKESKMSEMIREVWVDGSGEAVAVIMKPDDLGFRDKSTPYKYSLDQELQALVLATRLLGSERGLPTIFYTDCKSIVDGVKKGASLQSAFGSYRYKMLLELRQCFPKRGVWTLKWIERRRNKVADRLSRSSEAPYLQQLGHEDSVEVYSMNLGDSEFHWENGTGIAEKPQKPKGVYEVKPKPDHMSASEYLRSCLWPHRERVFACT
jgi:hypothetical protein